MQAPEPEPDLSGAGWGRLFRTLAPLGPRRVLARALRPARARWRELLHAAGARPGAVRWTGLKLPVWPVHEDVWAPPGRFTFLGLSLDLGPGPGWRRPAAKLWTYHLHYLDALRQESVPVADRHRLLEAWVASHPPGTAPGWEPYPTALRLVNALGFLAGREAEPAASLAASLALQAWWLAGTLERDVGANHLWKNALALAWAGRLLTGPSASAWRRVGDALVRRELRRQILADGFHVERTPTYHALLVEDLLRLEALLAAGGERGPLVEEVRVALARTGAALATVLHPDGEVPLFNDSAFGQAPRGDALVAAACRALGRRLDPCPGGLPDAGIFRLESAGMVLLFDVGEIGDPAQPGHAHADTLGFELSAGGRRVLVDAGVYDYDVSETRRYARGTRAHNTLSLDGVDQSEMWGAFRVGRRARPLEVRAEVAGPLPWVAGGHDGYRALAGSPEHRRRIESLGAPGWRITDEVRGNGRHRLRGAFRVHPDLASRPREDGAVIVEGPELRLALVPETGPPFRIEDGWYFPRMGERRPCAIAVQELEAVLPARLACRIERIEPAP